MPKLIRRIPARLLAVLVFMPITAAAADKPNIVLVVMDNFGWGEIGAYGGGMMRGAPTPDIRRHLYRQ
jgi:arylsulfatase